MPFTQREIDEAYELTCRFHGLRPEYLAGWPPLIGSDIKPDSSAEEITEALKHRLLWNH